MKNTLYIFLIVILFSVPSFADISFEQNEENCRIVVPEYIPVNSSFDISIITSHLYPEADRLEFYIIPDENLTLNEIEFNSVYHSYQLEFNSVYLREYSRSAYQVTIDLSDTTLPEGFYFQLLANIKSRSTDLSVIKFFGVFKNDDVTIGSLIIDDERNLNNEEKLITRRIKFYEPQRTSGTLISFNRNSVLNFNLNEFNGKNLLVDFWIKPINNRSKILSIKNKLTDDLEYELFTNQFQMLTVDSYTTEELFENPVFTGKKNWYHISVFASSGDNELSFYCNGYLFSQCKLPVGINFENYNFNFGNNEENNSFQMDLLRFYDYNNSLEQSFQNKSYLFFNPDSSSIIAQFTFDDYNQLDSEMRNLSIRKKEIQFNRSNAPIFARAPELNIKVLSNSYELEWTGGDYKQTVNYVLQKSTGSGEFQNIYSVTADNILEKKYSYLDPKDETLEIVYYRIKQINKDGSVVYSSNVKVGQGTTEQFLLKQNYPNPFNPKTSIEVELLEETELEITIYNLEGREVIKLHDGHLSKGIHKFEFDASELPSGIYLYKVTTPAYSQIKKMILAK